VQLRRRELRCRDEALLQLHLMILMPITQRPRRRLTSALTGTLAGAGIAVVVIACAAPGMTPHSAAPPSAQPSTRGAEPGATPHGQIAALDQAITQDMERLQVARPPAPDNACTDNCPHEMATSIAATSAEPANCKPGGSEKCGDTCKLKESICTAAGNICRIASDLGGADSYANDACNRGNASCDAAKQRCCSCL
jgi:hypothetical protein